MSKFRDDMVALRQEQFALVEELRKLGDFDAGASFARRHAETYLKELDLRLERIKQ